MNQHQVKRDSMSQVSEDALLCYMYFIGIFRHSNLIYRSPSFGDHSDEPWCPPVKSRNDLKVVVSQQELILNKLTNIERCCLASFHGFSHILSSRFRAALLKESFKCLLPTHPGSSKGTNQP